MIKDTFELFREPFDRASINRDYAIERDSSRAAITARFQYLAQIIVSIVSVPFLLLAGIYDLLRGNCNPLSIPLALFSQLFIILPISFFSLIAPMSWSRGLDKSLSDSSRTSKINNLNDECLPYLNEQFAKIHPNQARPLETIAAEDMQAAIVRKNNDLKAEALSKNLTQIKKEILAAPRGSTLQSNLYEMLKKKEEFLLAQSRNTVDNIYHAFRRTCDSSIATLDQLREAIADPALGLTDTLGYHNLIDALAIKRANGPETIQDLSEVREVDPTTRKAGGQACAQKYVAQNTFQQLQEAIRRVHFLPQATALDLKTQTIDIMAACEKAEDLIPPQGERDPIRLDLYQNALNKKLEYLAQLQAANSLETLRAELANTKNPVHKSDLEEAIIQKYRNNNSSNQRLSKESLVAAVAEGIQVSNLDFDIQLELDVG